MIKPLTLWNMSEMMYSGFVVRKYTLPEAWMSFGGSN